MDGTIGAVALTQLSLGAAVCSVTEQHAALIGDFCFDVNGPLPQGVEVAQGGLRKR